MGCVSDKQKKPSENQKKSSGSGETEVKLESADPVNSAWNDNDEPIVEQKQKPPVPNVKLQFNELDTIGVVRAYAGLKDLKISNEETYFEFFDCFSETLWQHIKVGISCNTNAEDEWNKRMI